MTNLDIALFIIGIICAILYVRVQFIKQKNDEIKEKSEPVNPIIYQLMFKDGSETDISETDANIIVSDLEKGETWTSIYTDETLEYYIDLKEVLIIEKRK